MRTTHYLGLTLVCLLACGCANGWWGRSTNTSRPGPVSATEPRDPFALSSREATSARDPINGVLAGYAFDRFRHPLSDATIEIVDLNEPGQGGKRARITTTTDRIGQYKFEGLDPTHQYQLIARTRDGNRQLVGTVLGAPPNPRLPIFLTEDHGGVDPRSAALEEDGKPGKPPERTNTISSPAATLAPPVKNSPDLEATPTGPTPTNSLPGSAVPGLREDRSRTTQDGYARNPIVTIPGPTAAADPVLPPAPRATPIPPPAPAPAAPPPTQGTAGLQPPQGPSPELPKVTVPTPSCMLIGRRLSNFSLPDMDGRPWFYDRDRDRNARVTLLDFWYTQCTPCLQTLPHLRALQRDFGPHGLQVIGITHEQGSLQEAQRRLHGARGRYNINYTTLLSGTTPGPCPVMAQFQVTNFPTLVLLDETGTIIWRKVGVPDSQSLAELDFILRKKLGLRGQ